MFLGFYSSNNRAKPPLNSRAIYDLSGDLANFRDSDVSQCLISSHYDRPSPFFHHSRATGSNPQNRTQPLTPCLPMLLTVVICVCVFLRSDVTNRDDLIRWVRA